jgi:hypothetical protein
MIPLPSDSINHLCMRIATDLLPKASDEYAASDLGMITVLLSMVSQDFERVADVHVREHAAITEIVAGVIPHLPADLAERAKKDLATPLKSYCTSDLNARTDIVMRLLIDVHAHIETRMDAGEAWAKTADADIWRFYDQYGLDHAYEAAF